MSSVSPFAAALFVGGRSTRMGQDKAGLEWKGRSFLDLQLETLRALAPAKLFLSTREEGVAAPSGVEVVPDREPYVDRGPLGGLYAVLARAEEAGLSHVLALAIDMPRMTPEWLRKLVEAGGGGRAGVMPEISGGRLEPLAALWPVALLPQVWESLEGNDASLHRVARRGIDDENLIPLPVPAEDEGLFLNVNRKSDWEGLDALS